MVSSNWRSIPRKIRQLISRWSSVLAVVLVVSLGVMGMLAYHWWQNLQQLDTAKQINTQLTADLTTTEAELATTTAALVALQAQDQLQRNNQLEARLQELQKVFAATTTQYERFLVLQENTPEAAANQKIIAKVFTQLAENQLTEAQQTLTDLTTALTTLERKIATTSSPVIAPAAVTSNQPPSSGFAKQNVETDSGRFVVSMVGADLNSTKVIVDTASDGDCGNNCPVLPLRDYVSRSGGYAGINGTYFCPESYPSCAGKTNSFDLLVMNKNKVYFNSANNVYSTNPAVIFSNGSIRFVGQAQEWGRDTSVDGVLSNYPLLVSGGEVRFGGDDDPKKGSRGSRGFIANKGQTVYIGVVYSATVAEAARVMKALGMDNAMNLDSGGSTALWANGYIVGPGRNIPNAIIFVRK